MRGFRAHMDSRTRVLVASPDPVECEMLSGWLAEQHDPLPQRVLAGVVHHLQSRRFDLMVADAGFAFDAKLLAICRGATRTPLVVVGAPNAAAEAAAARHGAFYVPRPVDREILLCAAAMALVDERPVRRSPRKPVARLEAMADGVPSVLVDVSNEGLRLEILRGRVALPPFFTVRVPLVGLSVHVQRIWSSALAPHGNGGHTWCGGALAENEAGQERNWRRFVDLVPRSSS